MLGLNLETHLKFRLLAGSDLSLSVHTNKPPNFKAEISTTIVLDCIYNSFWTTLACMI